MHTDWHNIGEGGGGLGNAKPERTLAVDDEAVISFAQRYANYIGAASDLPDDLAENLDRYVVGILYSNSIVAWNSIWPLW